MSAPPSEPAAVPRRLTLPEVWRRFRHEGGPRALRALPEGVEILVPRLEARAFSDLPEVVLGLFGPRRFLWRDGLLRSERGRERVLRGALAIARDLTLAPLGARLHARRAARVGRARTPAPPYGDGPPLYLRMDHNFDLRAGGSVAHTAGVLNALRSLLGEVVVVSTDRLASVEPDDHFHVVTPRYGFGRNAPLYPQLAYNRQVLDWWSGAAWRPRFVYARHSLGSYAALAVARAAGVPHVCEYNGSDVWIARHWGKKPLAYEPVMQRIEDVNTQGSDLVVTVSDVSRDKLVERGVPSERILVNPNGVDADRFGQSRESSDVRRRHGIADEDSVIGFIGTFGNWHGTEVLAEAFGRLLQAQPALAPRVRLLLIGDGNRMEATREILVRTGGMARTVLCGTVRQEAAPAHLAACDVLASPHVPNPDGTRFFGSPTKLFEYMAAERAIVASDLDQVGQVLEHERTALKVRPGDPDDLAAALARACLEPDLRRALGTNARQRCLAEHTWLRHTQRILDALEARLGRSTAR